MPNCRNCGARLSKFDTDLCPVCGIKNPLEGISSETVEITSQIDLALPEPFARLRDSRAKRQQRVCDEMRLRMGRPWNMARHIRGDAQGDG